MRGLIERQVQNIGLSSTVASETNSLINHVFVLGVGREMGMGVVMGLVQCDMYELVLLLLFVCS